MKGRTAQGPPSTFIQINRYGRRLTGMTLPESLLLGAGEEGRLGISGGDVLVSRDGNRPPPPDGNRPPPRSDGNIVPRPSFLCIRVNGGGPEVGNLPLRWRLSTGPGAVGVPPPGGRVTGPGFRG